MRTSSSATRNVRVCDGSAVPPNIGANPSLTIAAMTARTMQQVAPERADTSEETRSRAAGRGRLTVVAPKPDATAVP